MHICITFGNITGFLQEGSWVDVTALSGSQIHDSMHPPIKTEPFPEDFKKLNINC